MSVEQRLRALVENYFGARPEDVQPETSLYDDIGADSLEMTELMMSIEAEFAIEISPDAWVKVQTFGEIVTLVEGLLK